MDAASRRRSGDCSDREEERRVTSGDVRNIDALDEMERDVLRGAVGVLNPDDGDRVRFVDPFDRLDGDDRFGQIEQAGLFVPLQLKKLLAYRRVDSVSVHSRRPVSSQQRQEHE